MSRIINLATTAALTTVENKTPNVSDLVKKSDYDAKDQKLKIYIYINTSACNKFTSNALDAKITQKKLVNESDLNEKIKTSAAKEKNKNISNKGWIKSRER